MDVVKLMTCSVMCGCCEVDTWTCSVMCGCCEVDDLFCDVWML